MSAATPAGSAAISKPVLAALIHDTAGALLAPLDSGAADLTELFGGIALSITEATHPEVVAFLQNACGAHVRRHQVGEDIIGRARRSAVELALEIGAPRVFHSDFDSVLRWSQTDKAELGAVLARPDPFLIIGRNPDAGAVGRHIGMLFVAWLVLAHVLKQRWAGKVVADERDARIELVASQWARGATTVCVIGVAVMLGFNDTERLREFSYPFIAQMLMLALLWGLWFDQLVAALLYWRDRRAMA